LQGWQEEHPVSGVRAASGDRPIGGSLAGRPVRRDRRPLASHRNRAVRAQEPWWAADTRARHARGDLTTLRTASRSVAGAGGWRL